MSVQLKSVVFVLKFILVLLLARPFGNVIHDIAAKYDYVDISDLRKLEKISIKTRKAELDLNFLRNCQSFKVFPKFTRVNLPNVNHQDINAIRRQLLKSAIARRSKEYRKLLRTKNRLTITIKDSLSTLDFYILKRLLSHNVSNEADRFVRTHEKKLQNLTRNIVLPFSSDETVTNISSHTLTPDELEVLKFGLKHSIRPPKISKIDVFTCFELIHYTMARNIKDNKMAGKMASDLSHLAHAYFTSYKPSNADLRKHKILRNLQKNKSVVILKPDKGNGVVVLNRTDYDAAMFTIINDSRKFCSLKDDPTVRREGKLQRLLRKIRKNDHLDNKVYNDVYPKGSRPARIYGLPKMHKTREAGAIPKFRPIVSSIGTYNYNLSQYLCSLLQPHIPSEFCCTDSFSFVRELQSLTTNDKFMVSYDVESLFTNIPLKESIELAIQYILNGNPTLKLTQNELKELFVIATSESHFIFNSSLYDQIDGVAMGSPLAPVLANLFMAHHEREWLDNYDGNILFYRRYVDDTFCLFNTEDDANSFYKFINSRHPNISFTMEKEVDRKLAFLDVFIDNSSSSVITRVFRKKTYTGLLTNFFSFTTFSYKVGLIRTLVDRTFKINNTWTGFHKDVSNLMHILKKNLFPSYLIENTINSYVTKAVSTSMSSASNEKVSAFYFKIPYVGMFSRITQKRIRRLIKYYCNNLDIILIYTSLKVGALLSVKDPVPSGLRSRVVYKFSCAGCEACYVGETCRHFSTRVREHLTTDRTSNVFRHLENSPQCRSLCSADSFKIVDYASTDFQLKIKEAIHIKFEKPSLNAQVKHLNLKLSM